MFTLRAIPEASPESTSNKKNLLPNLFLSHMFYERQEKDIVSFQQTFAELETMSGFTKSSPSFPRITLLAWILKKTLLFFIHSIVFPFFLWTM